MSLLLLPPKSMSKVSFCCRNFRYIFGELKLTIKLGETFHSRRPFSTAEKFVLSTFCRNRFPFFQDFRQNIFSVGRQCVERRQEKKTIGAKFDPDSFFNIFETFFSVKTLTLLS
jgi:hypothetical protein